jgi:hypothetical protein
VFSDVDGFGNPIWVVTFYFKSPDRGFVSISFYRPRKCFNIYGQYRWLGNSVPEMGDNSGVRISIFQSIGP